MNHDLRDHLLAEAAKLADEYPVDLAQAVDLGIRRLRRRYIAATIVSVAVVAALAVAVLVFRAMSGPFPWVVSAETDSPSATSPAPQSPTGSTSASPTTAPPRQPLATGLRIDPASATIPAGLTRALSALLVLDDGSSISPAQVEVRWRVSWTSSNAKVAAVDDRGTVTGIGPGTATVTAVATDPNGIAFSATSRITVGPPLPVSIHLKPLALSLYKGGPPGQLTASVTMSDGSSQPLSGGLWASSNPQVATVDSQGSVKAVAPGTCTVTASQGGLTSSPATITVYVLS
ncbi:Ig-like domain-containing protein [Sinomonas sp. JGH33]|uniref:Ig-like domain-containing protein n=1 Tax=Sinomonas terricola TaxID=3110330 RepID=A0ABU5TA64_9MICC|nr:Ig-like domain-containing protein [Sinomonas sp. JGH33]MEA5456341.1 Ig-like domain-containing protein [Sinomonas sp. JGH33]